MTKTIFHQMVNRENEFSKRGGGALPKNEASEAHKPIVQRIHEAYPKLPEGERKVAEIILAAPAELAVCNAVEVAAKAEVSNATVTRFFQRLDYANFEEARQEARRVRATGSPLFSGQGAKAKADPISRLIHEEVAVIEATLSRVNPLTIREISNAIAAAPRIRTIGYRNSHFLAQYVTAQIAQMRPGVAPLLMTGQTESEGISSLGPKDLAIVVGLRRRPAGFSAMVEAIAARGTKILLLGDETIRTAPAFATWTLECVVDTPQFADSYVGALSILRLIAIDLERTLGKAGHGYLQEVEDLRDRLGELE
jgi:DNA-binding MurR/RpiR family transcriptional regulator